METLAIALALVGALAALGLWPTYAAAAGAWASTGGPRRPRNSAAAGGSAAGAMLEAEELFFPTYLAQRDTPEELAAALAGSADPVSVERARAVCRALRVAAELRDIAGRVQVLVDANGEVSRAPLQRAPE
jgi:hypothetical protein